MNPSPPLQINPEQFLANLFSMFLQSFPDSLQADQFYLTYFSRPAGANQFDLVAQQVDQLAQAMPGQAATALLKGHIALRQNRLDDAIKLYEAAVVGQQNMLTGHGAESLFSLGAAHFMKGNYQAAIDAFGQYRQMQPDGQNVHKFFSYYLGELKRAAAPQPMPQMQPPAYAYNVGPGYAMPQPQYVQPQYPMAAPMPAITQPGSVVIPRLSGAPAAAVPTAQVPQAPPGQAKAPCPPAPAAGTPCAKQQAANQAQPTAAAAKPPAPAQSGQPAKPTENKSDDGCFIATAAYGSPEMAAVISLRQFRDDYLQKNEFGRKFVRAYYYWSPPMARKVAQHAWLRRVIRGGLNLVVKILPQRRAM